MPRAFETVSSYSSMTTIKCWYDLSLCANLREGNLLSDHDCVTCIAHTQYPMNGLFAKSMKWVCREDLETELQAGIANHAQVLESALADPEFPYDQQATPEVMVLGGVSGIGKVRLKSSQPIKQSTSPLLNMHRYAVSLVSLGTHSHHSKQ